MSENFSPIQQSPRKRGWTERPTAAGRDRRAVPAQAGVDHIATPSYAYAELAPRNVSAMEEFAFDPATSMVDAVERLRSHNQRRRIVEPDFDGATAEFSSIGGDATPATGLYDGVRAAVEEHYRG